MGRNRLILRSLIILPDALVPGARGIDSWSIGSRPTTSSRSIGIIRVINLVLFRRRPRYPSGALPVSRCQFLREMWKPDCAGSLPNNVVGA
jgi:hypothetical protein